MAKKVKTKTEEAVLIYPLAVEVMNNEFARSAAYDAIAEIGRQLDLDVTTSTVALKEFAQYRLALLWDERIASQDDRIAELTGLLAKAEGKSNG